MQTNRLHARWRRRRNQMSTDTLTTKDLAIGTVIATVMAATFSYLSSGLSLIITFVPGLLFSWLAFVQIYRKQVVPPSAASFVPLFFVGLAVQFLHFAEEYSTGFATRFPELYGGVAYSDRLFVSFNMLSYTIFTLACLAAFVKGHRFMLMPVLFFIVYGAIGNAVSHTWWSLQTRSYFPGLMTAQLYWILGPSLLLRLLRSRSTTASVAIPFGFVLVTLLTLCAVK
ncbi:MAG: HXXEE domain-containing protein [Bryobacteraceae bacterium]|nr:HXXEE domain-containing protein [Bryobacteraceae bacterium]